MTTLHLQEKKIKKISVQRLFVFLLFKAQLDH